MRSDHSTTAIVVALATLVWLMTSTSVHATDRDVKTQLQQTHARADWRDVRIDVDHGVVTLTGEVPHVWAKRQIEKDAQQSRGVDRVVNTLSVPRVADDETLKETLERQVQQWAFGSMFDDISVTVLSGTAVLVGYLTTPQKLSPLVDLIDLIAKTPGVQQVVPQLEVLPNSPLDAQLRTTVADALRQEFGDLAAPHAAHIHIIVSNARVTLAGTVNSDQQRAKAEEILRGIPGVVSVANRLSVLGSAAN
jgi:osmotically-inducible protein OsmY